MPIRSYEYRFGPEVPIPEVRDSLALATIAVEGLHGRARVRLEVRFDLDSIGRSCRIDVSSPVSLDMARIFTGLLSQQFGEDGFSVETR